MGQVPAKYFYPSSPQGNSTAVNALSVAQPNTPSPQTPLLPPNYTDPGTTVQGKQQLPYQLNRSLWGNQY